MLWNEVGRKPCPSFKIPFLAVTQKKLLVPVLMSCDVCGTVSSRVLIRDAVSDFSSEAGHFGIFCPNVSKFSKKKN